MKTRILFALLLTILMESPMAFGHGWSEQMKQELDAQAPDWLSIGAPIKVYPANKTVDDQAALRPISGDSQSTRDRVIIPGRGIEIKVDYPISWYRGSSLSPDGTKLIINSGAESKVYMILPNGGYRAIELRLPRVTHDAGPKGFIAGWSWADNKTLIGEAEIDNEKGEFIEKRIYVFYVDKSALSRLDVSALNLPTTEGLTVSKVGIELDRLRISVGNSEFTVNADLKTPPKIEKQQVDVREQKAPFGSPKQSASIAVEAKPAAASEQPTSSVPWSVVAVLIVAAIVLLWLLFKRRN